VLRRPGSRESVALRVNRLECQIPQLYVVRHAADQSGCPVLPRCHLSGLLFRRTTCSLTTTVSPHSRMPKGNTSRKIIYSLQPDLKSPPTGSDSQVHLAYDPSSDLPGFQPHQVNRSDRQSGPDDVDDQHAATAQRHAAMRSGDDAISERDAHGNRAKVWPERGPNREGRGAGGQPTTIALRYKRGTRITCVLCNDAHYSPSPECCQHPEHALRVNATKRLSSTTKVTRRRPRTFDFRIRPIRRSG